MAVVKVTESWKQLGSKVDGIPGITPLYVNATKVYSVKFDVAAEGNSLAALTANDGTTQVPGNGAFYSCGYNYLILRNVHVLEPVGPTLFRVVCEYSGLVNPFSQQPVLRYAGMRHAEEVGHDATGKPYRNTVGQRLTGHTRDFYDVIFTLTRNEATDTIVGGAWRGVVNSDTVMCGDYTWAPKKVKIEDISATREYTPVTSGTLTFQSWFYPVTYTLAVRTHVVTINGGSATDIGWQYLEANHGSQYCAVSGGPTRDTVKYGLGPDVLLKQDGTLVMPTDPDSSLYWLLFDDFLPTAFAPLGLSF